MKDTRPLLEGQLLHNSGQFLPHGNVNPGLLNPFVIFSREAEKSGFLCEIS